MSVLMYGLPVDLWNYVLRTDGTKGPKTGPHLEKTKSKPTEHGGGGVMMWACFPATGPGPAATESTMTSSV